jgi:hypothetical protein
MVLSLAWSCASFSSTKVSEHTGATTTPPPPGHSAPAGVHSAASPPWDSTSCTEPPDPTQTFTALTVPPSGTSRSVCLSSDPLPDWTLESVREQLTMGYAPLGYPFYYAEIYACTGSVSDGWTWVWVWEHGKRSRAYDALFDASGAIVGYALFEAYRECCEGQEAELLWIGAAAPADIDCSVVLESFGS